MDNTYKEFTNIVELPFKKLTEEETELFIKLCDLFRMQKKEESNTCVFKLKDIAEEGQDIEALSNSLFKMNRKLCFELSNMNKTEYLQMLPFSVFRIDGKELTVICSDAFSYFITKPSNFKKNNLEIMRKITGKYATLLYIKMLQHANEKGKWDISLEDFRVMFDIPKSYKPSQIKERAIEPAIMELSEHIGDVKYEIKYEHNEEKTLLISGYTFSYPKEGKRHNTFIVNRKLKRLKK